MVGHNVVIDVISKLTENNQIANLIVPLNEFNQKLKPETSLSLNLGLNYNTQDSIADYAKRIIDNTNDDYVNAKIKNNLEEDDLRRKCFITYLSKTIGDFGQILKIHNLNQGDNIKRWFITHDRMAAYIAYKLGLNIIFARNPQIYIYDKTIVRVDTGSRAGFGTQLTPEAGHLHLLNTDPNDPIIEIKLKN